MVRLAGAWRAGTTKGAALTITRWPPTACEHGVEAKRVRVGCDPQNARGGPRRIELPSDLPQGHPTVRWTAGFRRMLYWAVALCEVYFGWDRVARSPLSAAIAPMAEAATTRSSMSPSRSSHRHAPLPQRGRCLLFAPEVVIATSPPGVCSWWRPPGCAVLHDASWASSSRWRQDDRGSRPGVAGDRHAARGRGAPPHRRIAGRFPTTPRWRAVGRCSTMPCAGPAPTFTSSAASPCSPSGPAAGNL
jgi:hypothetical protein